ncbi:Hypothetical protein CINCED_3A025754 [Cinara cedri]|uniref:Uncharacterized protein n=1 Tax=Cinara cedri TaxID=506608 RepID=A0A5E4NHX4_9HEMI|nr:Hypothetical protein CINCED_3A025754 [Cinara cedri]
MTVKAGERYTMYFLQPTRSRPRRIRVYNKQLNGRLPETEIPINNSDFRPDCEMQKKGNDLIEQIKFHNRTINNAVRKDNSENTSKFKIKKELEKLKTRCLALERENNALLCKSENSEKKYIEIKNEKDDLEKEKNKIIEKLQSELQKKSNLWKITEKNIRVEQQEFKDRSLLQETVITEISSALVNKERDLLDLKSQLERPFRLEMLEEKINIMQINNMKLFKLNREQLADFVKSISLLRKELVEKKPWVK